MGIVVALLQVLSSVAGIVVAVIAMQHAPTTAGQESANAAVAGVGAVLGQLISAVFPTVLFLILVRRRTAEAFERK
jgi:hypothetical protein